MSLENEALVLLRESILKTVKDAAPEYIKAQLFGWNTPFANMLKEAVTKVDSLNGVMKDALDEVIKEPAFKEELKVALRKRLVNELVKGFGLENTFKELRNSPEAKERLLATLEEIAKV